MRIYIRVPGEYEVGIPDFDTHLDLGIEPNDTEEREFIRKVLQDSFSLIYDDPAVSIQFADEREEWQLKELQLERQLSTWHQEVGE